MVILGVHNDTDHSNLDGKPQAAPQGIPQQQLTQSLPLMAHLNGQASKARNGKRKVGESVQVPGRQVHLSNRTIDVLVAKIGAVTERRAEAPTLALRDSLASRAPHLIESVL